MTDAPTRPDPSRGADAAKGMTSAVMARPAGGELAALDPLARGGGGLDPATVAERVVFRLWADGLVSGRAIEQARRDADTRTRLDQRLVRLGLVDEDVAADALAEALDAPRAEPEDFPGAPVLADLLPRRFVEEALALPLADDGAVLTLALADPIDDYALRAISMKTRRQVEVLVASPKRIRAAIARLYDDADRRGAEPRRDERREPRLEDRRDQDRRDQDRRDQDLRDEGRPRPNRDRARLTDAAAEADRAATPKFIRPKRVTRKAAAPTAQRRAELPPQRPAALARAAAPDPRMDDFDAEWLAPNDEPAAPTPRRRPEQRSLPRDEADLAADRRTPHPSRLAALQARHRPQSSAAAASLGRAADLSDARRAATESLRRCLRSALETRHRPAAQDRREPLRHALVEDPLARDPAAKYRAGRALDARLRGEIGHASPEVGSLVRHRLVSGVAMPSRSGPSARATADRAAADTRREAPVAEPFALGDASFEALDIAGRAAVDAALAATDGLVLVCGPAGSAKMATLRELARRKLGDGAEVARFDARDTVARLSGATRRGEAAARLPAAAIGEIRDAESAEAAARIAMLGGLVFAALDAPTAAAAPSRLIALGLPPYALASALRVAMTQTVEEDGCTRCGGSGVAATGGVCRECGGATARTRTVIREAFRIDDTLRALVLAQAPEPAFRHAVAAISAEAAALAARKKAPVRTRPTPPSAVGSGRLRTPRPAAARPSSASGSGPAAP